MMRKPTLVPRTPLYPSVSLALRGTLDLICPFVVTTVVTLANFYRGRGSLLSLVIVTGAVRLLYKPISKKAAHSPASSHA